MVTTVVTVPSSFALFSSSVHVPDHQTNRTCSKLEYEGAGLMIYVARRDSDIASTVFKFVTASDLSMFVEVSMRLVYKGQLQCDETHDFV